MIHRLIQNRPVLLSFACMILLTNTIFAQDNCNSAISVTDLTGVNCATSAPSLTNSVASAGCEEGTLDTWFSFVAQGPTAEIVVSNGTIFWEPEFVIAQSTTNDCSGTFSVVSCNDAALGLYNILTNSNVGPLVPGNTYWIVVSSNFDDVTGTISVCVDNPVAGPCQDNQDCIAPATVTLNGPGNGASCVTDCNTNASPGPDFSGVGANCQDLPNATVWYEFTTGTGTATIDVSVTSTDLSDPEFSIFTTNDCTNFTTIMCNEGSGGSVSMSTIGVAENSTYLIAVSDVTGDEGNFDLCITENPDNSACNTDNTLAVTGTSMGSPLTGPFLPGEIVSFCYTINTFTTGIPSSPTGCNYLQGIVPTFGDCWDPVSFDAQGMPSVTTALQSQGVIDFSGGGLATPICEGNTAGAWQWYPAGSVQYNLNSTNAMGYVSGDDVGAGWFFVSSYNPFGTTNATFCFIQPTDPDDSYGDNNYPLCTDLSGWQVCFDLQVKDAAACGLGQTDCGVSVKTFADGEIGVWSNIGCSADIPTTMPNSINCLLPVEMGSFSAEFVDNQVNIDWSTITEEASDYFIINHLTHYGDQVEIGRVEAAGNSTEELFYRFVHEQPHPGMNYYNLIGVDMDGTRKNHGYVTANADFNYVYYNADAKKIIVTYETAIEIYSMDGALVKSATSKEIPFEGNGVYIVRDVKTGYMQRIMVY